MFYITLAGLPHKRKKRDHAANTVSKLEDALSRVSAFATVKENERRKPFGKKKHNKIYIA